MARFGGIVLCGGESRRMGRSKAWLPIEGELMLPRVVRILSEVVRPIVVVAAKEQSLPALPADVRVVHDEEDERGPLQGLAAGLAALAGQVDAAYLSGCDVPMLKAAFVQRMLERFDAHSICMPNIAGRQHPLAAVYPLAVLPTVRTLLNADRRRLLDLADVATTRLVDENELCDIDPTFASLRNVNTPEDYAEILREINPM
jgi:molybdopterin-guanine dinucleotide biosynthesis protein A